LRNSFEATRKKCRDGLHPVAGEPLTVVGSFMASTLADRPEGTGGYHASGAVPFFADYIAAYRSTRLRRDLRFHSDFEKQIAGWSQDWARTFNEFTRTPAVTSSWGLDARKLREAFAGASIYPDRRQDIAETTRQHCREGNREATLEAANLNHELYPASAATVVFLATAQLCFGDSRQARALLEKARDLDDAEDFTSPGFLNGVAYELAGFGRPESATELLRIAVELHPQQANLYDSLGELELKAGHREASLAAYKKALAIDPKLESAIKALEAIERAE
jgi:tetratricopeptide (TPR) repeat protein